MSLIFFPSIFLLPLSLFDPSKNLVTFAFILFFLMLLLMLHLSNKSKVFFLFLSTPFVYLLTNYERGIPVLPIWNLYTLFYIGCLIAIAFIAVVYFPIRYNRLLGEKKISKLNEIVNNTFRLSLPTGIILEYKLAVCKDFAKLTASLLLKIYPDSKLYFITIFGHEAVGIKIENEIYVLDHRLPILTIGDWVIKMNRKASFYCSELIRDSKGKYVNFIKCSLPPVKSISEEKNPDINTDKLAEEVSKMMEIKQSSHEDKTYFEIELSDYVKYYDNDEIIEYSFAKAIKNRLESEFCGNLDKISKINFSQKNEKDLKVQCFYSAIKD